MGLKDYESLCVYPLTREQELLLCFKLWCAQNNLHISVSQFVDTQVLRVLVIYRAG